MVSLPQLGIACRYTGPPTPHLRLDSFPTYSCFAMPHLVHFAVSLVTLAVFITIALLLNMSEVSSDGFSCPKDVWLVFMADASFARQPR